ncbi:tRNA (guanosine(37)-N1)-methyltransferase TrmD [Candidatus Chlamydia sanziniae]|uniref:tRNA (guanine-N(1)-)-methyltransferase n=1 Tax=Candidatus Chlamydia sanziniae TaxID=1806891 RepID=A0A1A9HXT9_9CHLA|nr:tRNA (guanosine(37)-N1)-methyltransferase TrmD [Candidatus Chlamydia sanziniae]ANH78902.1 tRNA methyltransferase [Candidatus Chlamydia sanziniae]
MEIDILSLFPDYFNSPLETSILGKAIKQGILSIGIKNLRDFGFGKWKQVDDTPFGGGGMLLMAEPLVRAIRSIKKNDSRVVYLSPQGTLLTAAKSRQLAQFPHLILLCGHYEGIDERVIDSEVDEEISIGDYVVTNGGIAALVLIDAISRFVPGVLGNQASAESDSLENGLLKGPQYTRPRVFEGHQVPEVLFQGNHKAMAEWRQRESLKRTQVRRPDLYLRYLYHHSQDNVQNELSRNPLSHTSSWGQAAIVLEVNKVKRAKHFYCKVFNLCESLEGEENTLSLPDENKTQLWLWEVGRKEKGFITMSFFFYYEADFFNFLKRWELCGGAVHEKQASPQGTLLVMAQDLDGHTWVFSQKNKTEEQRRAFR